MDIWNLQFLICGFLFCSFAIFAIVNYGLLEKPIACAEKPFEPWINEYVLFIAGASFGETFFQYFRLYFSYTREIPLRHPSALKMVTIIATIQTFELAVFYSDWIPYTCSGIFGIQTPPVLWLEWTTTVPFMFFSVAMLDVKRRTMTMIDWCIESSAGFSLIFLFLTNFSQSKIIQMIFFMISNVLMSIALIFQYQSSSSEYASAKEEYAKCSIFCPEESSSSSSSGNNIKTSPSNGNRLNNNNNNNDTKDATVMKNAATTTPTAPTTTTTNLFIDQDKYQREIYDRYQVSRCKMNSTLLLFATFTFYPITFHSVSIGLVSSDIMTVWLTILSFVSKFVLINVLIDSHMEILDPNKFLLLEERKKYDENRLMFFRYIFHEIRVPLNSISLGIQLLQGNSYIPQEDAETLQMIQEGTNFISETLNDVISLQKLEGGTLQLDFKLFHAEDLVRTVLYNFRMQYQNKDINVIPIIEENVPEFIYADQFRLEHVLANLLSNAIKFSDPHSAIEVRVSYNTKMAGYVTFSVKDEGVGMSAEDQKQLFQPFKQIRPGELQKGRGSGLGLSICKMIVTLHDGSIGCESKKREVVGDVKSGGSEFFFNIKHDAEKVNTLLIENGRPLRFNYSLDLAHSYDNFLSKGTGSSHSGSSSPVSSSYHPPLMDSEKSNTSEVPFRSFFKTSKVDHVAATAEVAKFSEQDRARNPVESADINSLSDKSVNILVVDDVLSNRKMLTMILKKKGLTADQCVDGADAVQTVQAKGIQFYDIIFMDSLMPNMCGPEAAKTLRGLGFSKLIVGVTGNAMDTDITDFEQNGADVIFTKPMKVELMERLFVYCEKLGYQSLIHGKKNLPTKSLKTFIYPLHNQEDLVHQ